MKNTTFAYLAVAAIPATASSADVQLGCRSPKFAYVDENPVAVIASSIVKDKVSSRFRVTWGDSLGGASDQGTMLYDRKRNILKFYNTGGHIEGYAYRRSYLFTRISDKNIIQLSNKYNNQNRVRNLDPFDSLPKLLPTFGCKSYKLVDFTKGHL